MFKVRGGCNGVEGRPRRLRSTIGARVVADACQRGTDDYGRRLTAYKLAEQMWGLPIVIVARGHGDPVTQAGGVQAGFEISGTNEPDREERWRFSQQKRFLPGRVTFRLGGFGADCRA